MTQKWDQQLAGPYAAHEVSELRENIRAAGEAGYEVVNVFVLGGCVYVAVKRPVEQPQPTVRYKFYEER